MLSNWKTELRVNLSTWLVQVLLRQFNNIEYFFQLTLCVCDSKTHQTHTFSRVWVLGFRGPTLCPQPSEGTQFFLKFSELKTHTVRYVRNVNLGSLPGGSYKRVFSIFYPTFTQVFMPPSEWLSMWQCSIQFPGLSKQHNMSCDARAPINVVSRKSPTSPLSFSS